MWCEVLKLPVILVGWWKQKDLEFKLGDGGKLLILLPRLETA